MSANIELIVSALALAISKLAEPAVKDAYDTLKNLIKNHFAKDNEIGPTLDRFEKKPETWEGPLKEILSESSVGENEEIMQRAQALKALLQSDQASIRMSTHIIGNDNTSISVGKNDGTIIGTQTKKDS